MKTKLLVVLVSIFILLSTPIFAADYVYLLMNGKTITDVNQQLETGKSYIFYGWASSGIDRTVIYVKGQNLRDEGSSASITFTPSAEGAYELDIIGFSFSDAQLASRKFYLNVKPKEITKPGEPVNPPKEEVPLADGTQPSVEETPPIEEAKCTEEWTCSEWLKCIDGKQTRTCTDKNNCGTTTSMPAEEQSCEVQQPKQEEFCTYTGQSDFIGFCECLKEKKQTKKIAAKNGNSIKIGFANSLKTLNAADYNNDLSELDIAVIFNLANKKLYTFYGEKWQQYSAYARMQDIIIRNSLEKQFSNDACSAFNNLLSTLGHYYSPEAQLLPPTKSQKGPHLSVLIMPVKNYRSDISKFEKNNFNRAAGKIKETLIDSLNFASCTSKIKVEIPKTDDAWCIVDFERCPDSSARSQVLIDVTKNEQKFRTCIENYEHRTGKTYDRIVLVNENSLIKTEDCEVPYGREEDIHKYNVVDGKTIIIAYLTFSKGNFIESIEGLAHTFGFSKRPATPEEISKHINKFASCSVKFSQSRLLTEAQP